jgi:hypothetical protein
VSPPRGPPSSPPPSEPPELDDPPLDPLPDPEELDEPDELPLLEEPLPEELLSDPEELDEIPASGELLPPASVVGAAPPEEPQAGADSKAPIKPHHRMDRMVAKDAVHVPSPFWPERASGSAGRVATVRPGAPQA